MIIETCSPPYTRPYKNNNDTNLLGVWVWANIATGNWQPCESSAYFWSQILLVFGTVLSCANPSQLPGKIGTPRNYSSLSLFYLLFYFICFFVFFFFLPVCQCWWFVWKVDSESEGVRKFCPLVTNLGYLNLQAGASTCFRSTVNKNELAKNLSSKSEISRKFHFYGYVVVVGGS